MAELTAVRLADGTALAKVMVRADPGGAVARALGVALGQTRRDEGTLLIGAGPGEWLLLTAPERVSGLIDRWQEVAGDDEHLVSVIDVTSGGALARLNGERGPDVLAKVCGLDAAAMADGAAARSALAGVAIDIVRHDLDTGERSYLLHCDRSYGQYLFDVLMDAGSEFRIQPGGVWREWT